MVNTCVHTLMQVGATEGPPSLLSILASSFYVGILLSEQAAICKDFISLSMHLQNVSVCIEGKAHHKVKMHIFPLTCSTVYPPSLCWCEMPSFWR